MRAMKWILSTGLCLSLSVAGCDCGGEGEPDAGGSDATVYDSGRTDTTVIDSATADTAVADTAAADTAVADTAATDTAVADTAATDTAVADTAAADTATADDAATADAASGVDSATTVDAATAEDAATTEDAGGTVDDGIATVRTTGDGTGLDLPIAEVLVTYLKPAVGSDPAGFFVQAEQQGPALFVQVDPSTLNPVPAVGDQVSFTVTDLLTVDGMKRATGTTDHVRISTGNAVVPLLQDLTDATDIVTALNSYDSEYITVDGTLTGAYSYSGTGHSAATFDTDVVTDETALRLRLPNTLRDDLIADYGFGIGCSFTTTTPLWRYNDVAQVSAWTAADIDITACPDPEVLHAASTSPTTVEVAFDRPIDPASLNALATQFTFDNGLLATASVMGSLPTEVVITTSAQASGVLYTVTVADTLLDVMGAAISATANTATFRGWTVPLCSPSVVISQVYGGGGNSGATYTHDYVELHNREAFPVSVDGWSIQYASTSGSSWSKNDIAGTIAAGGYFLIKLAGGTTGASLPTPDVDITSSPINLAGSNGKVALVADTTGLPGDSCPTSTSIVDFLGYGSANCFEGSDGSAPTSNTNAAFRKDAPDGTSPGCQDTSDNAADFVVQNAAPRNSASTANACTCN